MTSILALILSSATLAIGLFSAAQLATRRTASAYALAVFMLLSAAGGLDQLLDRTGVYTAEPGLTGVLWAAGLFIGPAILAYLLAMTADPNEAWTVRRIVRFGWPAAAAVGLTAPFFFLPPTLRLAIYSGDASELDAMAGTMQVIFSATFLIVSIGYLVAAYAVLGGHLRRIRDLFSNIEDRTLHWLRVLLLVMSAAWIGGAIKSGLIQSTVQADWLEVGAAVVELGWTTAIGLFGLSQKPIFTRDTETPQILPPPEKYARSALPETRQADIAARLEQVMRIEALYRDPLLSLSALAARIAITPNHLSQTLNDHLKTSFFDYVNRWRVEEAIARIETTQEPILNIAYDVGFNSRSTFNAAVKKQAGKPPSAFRPPA